MNMEFRRKLPGPEEVIQMYPVSEESKRQKAKNDEEIRKIFTGESDKLLLVIGPCSADREDAVLDYISRLRPLQEKVQDDSLELQKFTASVTLKTLAHSDKKGKTVESGTVKVPVNETNTDAAEDAQSMDSAESVAPAETAESTAAESAPASVPPVLMRARAALPMATPETAAAPDETDAAETAPPKQTETSDAS